MGYPTPQVSNFLSLQSSFETQFGTTVWGPLIGPIRRLISGTYDRCALTINRGSNDAPFGRECGRWGEEGYPEKSRDLTCELNIPREHTRLCTPIQVCDQSSRDVPRRFRNSHHVTFTCKFSAQVTCNHMLTESRDNT